MAREVAIPPATLGGWFSGRNLPQPGHLSGLRQLLRVCGVAATDIPLWLAAVERAREANEAYERPAAPYPGLTSFGVHDAATFFGRAGETDRVVSLLDESRMVAVVGPSGSGKTSLLRAGVAARLVADGRSCVVMTPGAEPARALDEASTRSPEVLIVDQFEEVFTAVADPDVRGRFLRELDAVAQGGTRVMLGLRADFYAAAAAEPVLLEVLRRHQLLLGPLDDAALREAIVFPAATVGVEVADGLVDLVLADLAPRDSDGEHDAGALPLLSHALRTAWDDGDGPVLTVEQYRRAGGIEGAVQGSAEAAYAAIGPDRHDDARRLFLRLVTIDDVTASSVAVTRRRVTGAEFDALRDSAVVRVIDEFVERRLLTIGDGTLEISHEALVTAWPRLRDWIDEDRLGLALHRQITEAANAWLRAGRDETLLLRGARLDAAAELAAEPTPRTALNPVESDFVMAGVATRDRARRRARRTNKRLQRLLAAVVVLLLAAGGLAAYALRARSEAGRAEQNAATARDEAQSRQLALESAKLSATDPALAQQVALAAFRTAPTVEARSAVIDASAQPIVTRILGRFGYTPLAVSPDGRFAAVGQAGRGEIRLLTLTAQVVSVVATLRRPYGGASTGLAFSHDSRRLFAVGTAGHLVAYDVSRSSRPKLVADSRLGRFVGRAIALSPDDSQAIIGGRGDCPVQRWTLSPTPRLLPRACEVPRDLDIQTVAAGSDGKSYAAAGRAKTLYLWRAATRPTTVTLGGNLIFSLLFAGSTLYAGDSDGHISVVDIATGSVRSVLGGKASLWVLALALSPDGTSLEAGGSDSVLRRYSLRTLRQTRAVSYPTQVTGVAFRPGTSDTIVTSGNGSTYVVPARGARFESPATTFNLDFDRRGDRVLAATDGDGGGVRVWDVRPSVPNPVTGLLRMSGGRKAVGTGAITASGQIAASGTADGYAQLFDLRAPATARPFGTAFRMLGDVVESMAFDPHDQVLAAGGDDSTIALWAVGAPTKPEPLTRLRGTDTFYSVAWSPSGALLAGANVDGHAYLWAANDPARPRLLAKLGGFDQEVWSVAFSSDSTMLAATGSDRTTRLWSIRDPKHPKQLGSPFTGPSDYVYAASFSPDNRLLAVSSNDGTVRIYDLHSAQRTPLVTLTGGGPNLFAVAFSPNGRQLVASGRGDSAVVWTTDPEVYAKRLCARTGTSITRSEWSQLAPGAAYDPPCR